MQTPMTLTLTRNGEMVEFLSINIGAPFFAHDSFWIRTDYEAASQLLPNTTNACGSCCNFNIDKEDKMVETVRLA